MTTALAMLKRRPRWLSLPDSLDPEVYGPRGLGCSLCHENEPIIWGLAFGALCDVCLERCLPGWSFDRIVAWLGRQRVVLLRMAERAEALQAWRKRRDKGPALKYQQKYGVWLLEGP